jgi:hypothetical protein
VGAIRDGRPAAEIVRALVQEAEEALDRVAVLRRSGVSSDTGGKARPGRVMATPMHLVEGREKDATMPLWKADLTFYPSPRAAPQAPRETLAYVLTLNPADDGKPDALCVVDVDPDSAAYGQVVGRLEMPHAGDELHHFGWNACRPARTAPRRGLFTT